MLIVVVSMFVEIFRDMSMGKRIDTDLLGRRFDLAITKKLGVVKLPPSFWMRDPKINPRSDHLLWAALLLDDPERVALACSVLAVEYEEQQKKQAPKERIPIESILDDYVQQLLAMMPDIHADRSQRMQRLVDSVKPCKT